ncbi:hypothetical protein [Rossellomorea marisflavi]|uniref:hypothetical protein n=1 Tax=Rossellomorea marisflavi TaxID=189381 RepID=UPI003FA0B815
MGYSTGEMLNKLGLEDEAENQKGYVVGYDHKGNLITWDKGENKPLIKEGNEFTLYYPWVNDDVWTITKQS